MCVPDKGGAPPVDLLPLSLYDDHLGPHFLAGIDGVVPVSLGLGEDITVSTKEHTVPLAGLTQVICREKHIRRTYLETCVPISLQPLRSPEPGPFLTTVL